MENYEIKSTATARGIIATKAIESGEFIFSDSPLFVAQYSINRSFFPACPVCMAPIQHVNKYIQKMLSIDTEYEQFMNVVSCESCSQQYCTLEHKEQDRTHKAFCNNTLYNELISWWSTVHQVPEWTTPELILKIAFQLVIDGTFDTNDSTVNHFIHCLPNLEDEMHLIEHLTNQHSDIYFQKISDAFEEGCRLLGISIEFSYTQFKDIILACALNGQGVGTSPLDSLRILNDFEDEQLETLASKLLIEYPNNAFTHCEGTALYKTHAMLNHSCIPNAHCQFTNLDENDLQNGTIEIIAIQDINKGDEICISYNESDQKANYNYEMYRFHCKCTLCLK